MGIINHARYVTYECSYLLLIMHVVSVGGLSSQVV